MKNNTISSFAGTARVIALVMVVASVAVRASWAQGFPVSLQITSPTDGTVVHRGDTVTVVVTPATGGNYQGVILNPDANLRLNQSLALINPGGPPYQFSFIVPNNATIGSHSLHATAGSPGQQPVQSADIHIDVEPSASLVSIRIEPVSISLGPRADDHVQLRVYGTFSDGSVIDITKSLQMTYTSSDPSIATVSSTGLVTAASSSNRGTTVILVHFAPLNSAVSVGNTKIPPSH